MTKAYHARNRGHRDDSAALPHRYPFLMIDRIIDMRGEDHGVGIKNVTSTNRNSLGIFPAIR